MATILRTSDGDILDTICYRHYGHLNGSVELVLANNYGLAAIPQPYRRGLLITLPDMPAVSSATIRLWDE